MGRTRTGTVYLIHFERPYEHARHYTGWTSDLDARLTEHQAGRGARLMSVIRDAGIGWTLARTWTGTRSRERQLKVQGGASRHCPACKGQPVTASWQPVKPPPVPSLVPGSIAAELTKRQAAALVRELDRGQREAWRIARPGPDYGPRLETACELTKLAAAEKAAQTSLAHERQGEQYRRGPARSMGNMQEQQEVIEAQRAGAKEADEVTMAAIQHGDRDGEQLADWARHASTGLAGAAVTEAERAFAAGFGRQALSLAAEYSRGDRSLAASSREPGAPHPDPALAATGWPTCQHGIYQRTGQPAAAAEREREAG